MGMGIVVPVGVGCYEYCYCVWVVLGNKSCPVEGLLGFIFGVGVGIPIPYPFMLECCPYRYKYFVSGEWGGELSK